MLLDTHLKWQGFAPAYRAGTLTHDPKTCMTHRTPLRRTSASPAPWDCPCPGLNCVWARRTLPHAKGRARRDRSWRGPNLFKGAIFLGKCPEKTAADMRADGWFITGDIARSTTTG